MYTIALLAQKGGTGKTTLAVHVAADFEGAGGSAALIDLDPQASAALWGDRRGRSPFVGAVPAARLDAALAAARRSGAGLVVIDTAPHSESAALAAARAADLALVPLRPGLFDIAALDATVRLCTLASLPFAVVLNHVPPRGRTTDLAEAAVRDYGAEVAPQPPPKPRRHFTTFQQIDDLVRAREMEPSMSFIMRLLLLCSLPRTNPGKRTRYIRRNGPHTLVMSAAGQYGLPYGNIPRLLLAWVCTEAVRTQSRELTLGSSMHEFMERLRLRYIVRRAKALAPSGCKSRPANCRSSRKQSERLMEATTWTEALCCKRVAIGRFSEHAGRNQMNAEQASKKSMRRPTRRCNGEGCQRPGSERRAHRTSPPGYWRQHACQRGTEATREAPSVVRTRQTGIPQGTGRAGQGGGEVRTTGEAG